MTDRETGAAASPCPRCGAALFAGKVGHFDALGCGACGGLWLDNAGTVAVLQHYDLDAEKLARLVDGNAAKHDVASPFADAGGQCPVCAQPLQPVEHRGVRLDFCAPHGTFFDRGELARILHGTKPELTPYPVPLRGPSIAEVTTTVRHEIMWSHNPVGTALIDWATGGPDWVNKWRR